MHRVPTDVITSMQKGKSYVCIYRERRALITYLLSFTYPIDKTDIDKTFNSDSIIRLKRKYKHEFGEVLFIEMFLLIDVHMTPMSSFDPYTADDDHNDR